MGEARGGSGMQQHFQPRQTNNKSSLLELQVVQNIEQGNDGLIGERRW